MTPAVDLESDVLKLLLVWLPRLGSHRIGCCPALVCRMMTSCSSTARGKGRAAPGRRKHCTHMLRDPSRVWRQRISSLYLPDKGEKSCIELAWGRYRSTSCCSLGGRRWQRTAACSSSILCASSYPLLKWICHLSWCKYCPYMCMLRLIYFICPVVPSRPHHLVSTHSPSSSSRRLLAPPAVLLAGTPPGRPTESSSSTPWVRLPGSLLQPCRGSLQLKIAPACCFSLPAYLVS